MDSRHYDVHVVYITGVTSKRTIILTVALCIVHAIVFPFKVMITFTSVHITCTVLSPNAYIMLLTFITTNGNHRKACG